MESDAGKRRRDGGDELPAAAVEPAKPRKRRFDSGPGPVVQSGADLSSTSVVHLQADIASLQQQLSMLYGAVGIAEDQRAPAIQALQGIIAKKQADLDRVFAASGMVGGAPSAPSQAVPAIVPAAAAAAAAGARIYVGAMPYEATEFDVRSLFSQFGNIVKVDMSFEPLTGKTKGYCFIAFDSSTAADKAISTMNGASVLGRTLKVSRPNAPGSAPAVGPAVGAGGAGLLSAAVSSALASHQLLLQGGPAGMWGAAALAPAGGGAGGSEFSAQIASAADDAAAAALRVRAAAASGAVAFRVYVGSVPFEITADHLRQIFSPFGAIRDVSMLPSQEPGVPGHRGYGFIEFEDESGGRAAIDAMNGFEIGGRKLRVNLATSANAPGGGLPPMLGGAAAAAGVAQPMQQPSLLQSSAAALPDIAALAAAAIFGGGGGGPPPLPPSAPPPPPPLPPLPPPPPAADAGVAGTHLSCVVAIQNMATAADLADPDLEADILGEAGKCGPVAALRFARQGPGADARVVVFVVYTAPAHAALAVSRLGGRYFGAQVTAATLFPQARFDAGDLALP